ncbi:hypothetical protein F5X96DRAFT_645025 [Biscogniauxia mediterranea]|nr:hypothetical protein F5X96DRAFT_645025 [Biscogniauxia mediterranea]
MWRAVLAAETLILLVAHLFFQASATYVPRSPRGRAYVEEPVRWFFLFFFFCAYKMEKKIDTTSEPQSEQFVDELYTIPRLAPPLIFDQLWRWPRSKVKLD